MLRTGDVAGIAKDRKFHYEWKHRFAGKSESPATKLRCESNACKEAGKNARIILAKKGINGHEKKPNFLIIWGDDIGTSNLSIFTKGMMGYRTPNIDRIAEEGILFTDSYGEQSCTAGRAAFITGQSVFRTGLSKVGLPGADLGLRAEDPTIAELLKPLGYATGQFGKNHFGDKDEFLPTNHGFDEFFGFLYHLNAMEEPEMPDYPPASDYPNFKKNFGPRGVLDCKANPDGTQSIGDTGPLGKKRMETIDDEVIAKTEDFIERAGQGGRAILRLVQHAPTCTSAPMPSPRSWARRALAVGISRRHDRARPNRRQAAQETG